MQVKGGALTPRPSPRGAAWLPEISCACVCVSRVLQRTWIIAAFNKCLVKLSQSLLVLTIKYPGQCRRCKIQHARGEVEIKMSHHMPLPCSALAVWCWLNLRGANSARRKPIIFSALTSRGKTGGRNNCSFVFKLKIIQVVWNLPIWRNYFWHQLCFFWFGAWKNGVIKSCTLSLSLPLCWKLGWHHFLGPNQFTE